MRRVRAVLVALAILFGLSLVLAPSASAHATVVGSDPVDGSRLKAAPTSVTVDFDQSVSIGGSIGYLHVIDQVGRRVDTGTTTHPGGDASKIMATLKSGLGDGTYTASFRIISADSHPVAGAVRFVVGNGSFAAAVSAPSTVDGLTSKLFQTIRWIGFAGLALLGGSWLMFTVWPDGRDDRRARRLVWTGWWLAVVGTVLELLIQGPYDAGSGPSAVRHWTLLDATLHTNFGLAHSLRLIALGVGAALLGTLLRQVSRTRAHLEEVGALLVAGIAVTWAASGHAATEKPEWLSITSDTVHLLSMAAWAGGLVYLFACVLPRSEPFELQRALPMFSRVAYVSVALLAVTGTYQAWLGVGSWRALAITTYGQLVLVKIALFVGLLALGNLSRRAVQRQWGGIPVAYALTDEFAELDEAELDESESESESESEDEYDAELIVATTRLRRVVIVETVLAAFVLAATAVLVAEPPGAAALITVDSRPQTIKAALGDGRTASVTLSTRRHGEVNVTVALSAGAPPQSITATAALPAKQLGPINLPLAPAAGSYSASAVLFPSAGQWVITLTVRTSEFDSTVTNLTATLH